MQEKIKLNEIDLKLLAYLYHHNREPLTKIARATKLTRQQVEYRLENYIKSGLIRQFFTIINYSAIGLSKFAILFLKVNKYSNLSKVKKSLKNNKNCISFGELQGEYDLYVDLICKDEKGLNLCVNKIISSEFVSDYFLMNPYFTEIYPIKFADKKHDKPFSLIDNSSKSIDLTRGEREVLKVLAEDSRISLVNLADKCKISSELAFYTIKRLEKQGVIQGTKIFFDLSLIGYNYMAILFNVSGDSNKIQEKLKYFARNNPYVNSLGLSINKPNGFMQIFYKNPDELKKVILELRKFLKIIMLAIIF
jgi:Lrp/AsnC family transcriptional regulator for asnA, asnC and gidA